VAAKALTSDVSGGDKWQSHPYMAKEGEGFARMDRKASYHS